MNENIDSKDLEILRILRKDSRTSMGNIGESLSISKATVSRRLAKMEKDKVISSYSTEIDPTRLGVMKSLLYLQVVGSPVSIVVEELSKYKEVRYIYKSFGDHNLVCELYTNTVDDLYEMIQTRVLKLMSIKNVEVDILVDKVTVDENADIKLHFESNFQK